MTCAWEADAACLGASWGELDPEVQHRSLMLATSSLQTLTYYRVGSCPITIRPCPEPLPSHCGCGFNPHMEHDGRWYNNCVHRTSCSALSEFKIPGPVGYIESLLIDGVEQDLASNDWRLDDGHILVWQGIGASPLPATQDLNLPDTEPGTWSLTYSKSYPVLADGRLAVAYLAAEFAKACQPKGKCALPRGVTSVTRNGVSFTVEAGLWPGGLTGIDVVDQFILKWAPAGSPQRSAVIGDPNSLLHQPRVTNSLPLRGAMSFIKYFGEDPQDFNVDWSSWLSARADTIVVSTWVVDTPGITVSSETETTTSATVWLSGGTLGESYSLTNQITTAGGRSPDQRITVRVRER